MKKNTLPKENIGAIEATTEAEAREHALVNVQDFKPGFNLYIVDFGGYFGVSRLLFKNGRHLYHASDYQLHHQSKSEAELIAYYMRTAKTKVFTDEELLEQPLKNYNDFLNKQSFALNIAPQTHEYRTAWHIRQGKDDNYYEIVEKEFPFFVRAVMAYVKDQKTAEYLNNLLLVLDEKYEVFINSDNLEQFQDAIAHELANHEACITGNPDEALYALGLNFDTLTLNKQKIVIKELRRQINEYC